MMGKQSEQIQMVILDIDSMIPETHLLRRIKKDMSIFPFFAACLAFCARNPLENPAPQHNNTLIVAIT